MTKPDIFAWQRIGHYCMALTSTLCDLTLNPSSAISQTVTAWGQYESSKEGKMNNFLTIIPFVILLCFTFGCQQGEEVAAVIEVEPTIMVDNSISADGVYIAYEVIYNLRRSLLCGC